MAQPRTKRPVPRTQVEIFDEAMTKLASGPESPLASLAAQWQSLGDDDRRKLVQAVSRVRSRAQSATRRSSASTRTTKAATPSPAADDAAAAKDGKKKKKDKKKGKKQKKDRKSRKKDKKNRKKKGKKDKKRAAEKIAAPATPSSPMIPPDTP